MTYDPVMEGKINAVLAENAGHRPPDYDLQRYHSICRDPKADPIEKRDLYIRVLKKYISPETNIEELLAGPTK
jgi:hypothetical protein